MQWFVLCALQIATDCLQIPSERSKSSLSHPHSPPQWWLASSLQDQVNHFLASPCHLFSIPARTAFCLISISLSHITAHLYPADSFSCDNTLAYAFCVKNVTPIQVHIANTLTNTSYCWCPFKQVHGLVQLNKFNADQNCASLCHFPLPENISTLTIQFVPKITDIITIEVQYTSSTTVCHLVLFLNICYKLNLCFLK